MTQRGWQTGLSLERIFLTKKISFPNEENKVSIYQLQMLQCLHFFLHIFKLAHATILTEHSLNVSWHILCMAPVMPLTKSMKEQRQVKHTGTDRKSWVWVSTLVVKQQHPKISVCLSYSVKQRWIMAYSSIRRQGITQRYKRKQGLQYPTGSKTWAQLILKEAFCAMKQS